MQVNNFSNMKRVQKKKKEGLWNESHPMQGFSNYYPISVQGILSQVRFSWVMHDTLTQNFELSKTLHEETLFKLSDPKKITLLKN